MMRVETLHTGHLVQIFGYVSQKNNKNNLSIYFAQYTCIQQNIIFVFFETKLEI